MNSNAWIRQIHRWVSIAFTVGVITNIVVMSLNPNMTPAWWVGMTALVPLIVLLLTGLYMFVLPYLTQWRSPRRAGHSGGHSG